MIMARLNKLGCEYTLEEAKNVDVNDVTTHPFFKKHFSKAVKNKVKDSNGDEYISYKAGGHEIRHYPVNHKYDTHVVEVGTHSTPSTNNNDDFYYYGDGQHKTAHTALESAIKHYKDDVSRFKPLKPLTESLIGKKPATASKLFAEAMETRLDEISKKVLGSYAKKAVADRDELHYERDFSKRLAKEFLANGNKEKAAEFSAEAARLSKKRAKRVIGINKAIDRLTKEDLDEVEAPANFWNAGMARMNPIQVSQKQPAEPGQFKATLTKSPKRLADQDSSVEGKPRAVRDETEAAATSRGPKTIELTGDWHADVPDHQFDPKLDSETEYYPLFSQFKSLGAYPSGPARAWEEEEIDEDELNEISKNMLKSYLKKAKSQKRGLSVKIDNDFKKMQHATDWSPESEAMKAAKRTNSISHKYHTRNSGIQKAAKKLSEDELNEISKRTLGNYLHKAIASKTMSAARYMQTPSGSPEEKKQSDITSKRNKGIRRAIEKLSEDELNEISKKTLGRYIEIAANSKMMAGVRSQEAPIDSEEEKKQLNKIRKRSHGISRAVKKLTEDSASLMATATKDEKKAAEQDKKKPAEFKKLHDKHEAEVKSKMKELGEEALQEGLFDPAKQPLLALWDEHARRSDAHGSGSRTEILKRIEDHVAKKHGQEGLKKMRLHSDLSNALKNSVSGDKGHLQALLSNMRAKCSVEG